MKTRHIYHAVDSHTEGMPTRVITGGVGVIPGRTMAERRVHFQEHLDDLRTLVARRMCGAYQLSVPLEVSFGTGSSWEEAGH